MVPAPAPSPRIVRAAGIEGLAIAAPIRGPRIVRAGGLVIAALAGGPRAARASAIVAPPGGPRAPAVVAPAPRTGLEIAAPARGRGSIAALTSSTPSPGITPRAATQVPPVTPPPYPHLRRTVSPARGHAGECARSDPCPAGAKRAKTRQWEEHPESLHIWKVLGARRAERAGAERAERRAERVAEERLAEIKRLQGKLKEAMALNEMSFLQAKDVIRKDLMAEHQARMDELVDEVERECERREYHQHVQWFESYEGNLSFSSEVGSGSSDDEPANGPFPVPFVSLFEFKFEFELSSAPLPVPPTAS
jgi:hypothetical protein